MEFAERDCNDILYEIYKRNYRINTYIRAKEVVEKPDSLMVLDKDSI